MVLIYNGTEQNVRITSLLKDDILNIESIANYLVFAHDYIELNNEKLLITLYIEENQRIICDSNEINLMENEMISVKQYNTIHICPRYTSINNILDIDNPFNMDETIYHTTYNEPPIKINIKNIISWTDICLPFEMLIAMFDSMMKL